MEERIREDLKKSIKEGNKEKTNTLRYLISEFQRRKNPHDKISDKEIISLIQKLIKSEKELLELNNEKHSNFIIYLEEYLPEMMNKHDIEKWINENMPEIIETEPNNRIKFMKNIMTEIGSNVNGNDVKEVLTNLK